MMIYLVTEERDLNTQDDKLKNVTITEGYYTFLDEKKADKFADRMNELAKEVKTGYTYDVIKMHLIGTDN